MADTSNNLNQENIYSYNSRTGYNPAVQQTALNNLYNQYSQPTQNQPATNIYSAPIPKATEQQKQSAAQNAYNVIPSKTTYDPNTYAQDISAYANNQVNNSTLEQFFNRTNAPDGGYAYNIKPEYVQLLNIDKFGAPTMAPKTINLNGVEQTITPDVPEMFYTMKGLKSPQRIAQEEEQARLATLANQASTVNKNFQQSYQAGGFKFDPNTNSLSKVYQNTQQPLRYMDINGVPQVRYQNLAGNLNTIGIQSMGVGQSFIRPDQVANYAATQGYRPDQITEANINKARAQELQNYLNTQGGIESYTGGDVAGKELINRLLTNWGQGLNG